MATVGQALTTPEAGWRRLENSDINLTYTGTWTTDQDASASSSSYTYAAATGSDVRFNFTGTKIRLIGALNNSANRCASVDVYIDGNKVVTFNQIIADGFLYQSLDCSIESLVDKEHYVKIVPNGEVSSRLAYIFDAIDIDENGELKPYNPAPSESDQALLRVTMIDSSEREYKLPKTDIDGFIGWLDSHSTGDTLSYPLNTAFGSKEHLVFDKIISFEVIPVA